MAAEGKLRAKLKERVEAYGGEIRAVSWLGRRFAPDVLCLFPPNARYFLLGKTRKSPVFIEAKAQGKCPTVGQLLEHERMKLCGCEVRVIASEFELDEWLPPL